MKVAFALQFYYGSAIIECFARITGCATTLGLEWRLLVNIDDSQPAHLRRWQKLRERIGDRRVQLIMNDNIHELRAYNAMARTASDSDLVIFLQDDDQPPQSCEWLERLVAVASAEPRVGLIGMRRSETPSSGRMMRNSSSCIKSECLCHRSLGMPVRFVWKVDLAPMAARPAAFLPEGFPTNWTGVGAPGIGVDHVLSVLMWERGWSVLHLPSPAGEQHSFVQVLSRPHGVGNSQGRVREQQWDNLQKVLSSPRFAFEGSAAFKSVDALNAERTVHCDDGGERGEWRRVRREHVERKVDARPQCRLPAS